MRQQGRALPVYRVREILRLHYELGLSDRAIARAHGVHHTTVGDLIRRFESEGGQWPLPDTMTDTALHQWLYRGHGGRPRQRPEPDWAQVHAELRRKGMTLQLLWQEYRAQHPDGYPVLPVLRTVPPVCQNPGCRLTQDLPAGRVCVCRLRRPHGPDRPSEDRGGPTGPSVCGGARLQ